MESMGKRNIKTGNASCVICGCLLNYGERVYTGNPYKPRIICRKCCNAVNRGQREIPSYMHTKKRRFDNPDEE